MSFFTIEVDDEKFQEWALRTRRGFRSMSETLKDVAQVLKENTIPLTPKKTTKLAKSFKWSVLENNSNFQVVQVRMSALNERTGYDYAMTQHRGYHHNKKGWRVEYHYDGGVDLGDSWLKVKKTYGYYPSDIGRLGMLEVPTNYFGKGGGGIGPQYLYRGVMETQDDAFELIESDYLSLFTRGHIY